MLILLRQSPDERLQEVISSLAGHRPCHLVYLDHSLTGTPEGTEPFSIDGKTSCLDDIACPSIRRIDIDALLSLIRDNPEILVLP